MSPITRVLPSNLNQLIAINGKVNCSTHLGIRPRLLCAIKTQGNGPPSDIAIGWLTSGPRRNIGIGLQQRHDIGGAQLQAGIYRIGNQILDALGLFHIRQVNQPLDFWQFLKADFLCPPIFPQIPNALSGFRQRYFIGTR